LHWLTFSPEPIAKPNWPLMNSAGRPELKSFRLRPGMPASAAGVVPKSDGSTFTLYWNAPKRTSRTVVGSRVKSAPNARLWLRTLEVAPIETSCWPPPGPNAVGPLRSKSA
jgi:hypothetical protein